MRNADAGRGRLFLDPAKQHDDLRLLRRAIKKRWEIPEDFRTAIVTRLQDLVLSDDDEIALKAIAEARHLEAQNQKDEHKIIDVRVHRKLSELAGIASELGIDVDLVANAERASAGGIGRLEGHGDRPGGNPDR